MKRTSVWLDEQQIKILKRIAKQKGSLQVSQCIRMAIAEFIAKETK